MKQSARWSNNVAQPENRIHIRLDPFVLFWDSRPNFRDLVAAIFHEMIAVSFGKRNGDEDCCVSHKHGGIILLAGEPYSADESFMARFE